MTTFEPGASEVFTHGFVLSPFATALRASMPAASITDGFDVLVQLVMAAMTTAPCRRVNVEPLYSTFTPSCSWAESSDALVATAVADNSGVAEISVAFLTAAAAAGVPALSISPPIASRYISFARESGTRSCGRFGPARLGSTVERSSSRLSVKTGSGVASVRKEPLFLGVRLDERDVLPQAGR